MAESMLEFITIMITAVTLENVVFTRALGTNKMFFQIKDVKSVCSFGVTLTIMTTLSGILNFYFAKLLSLTEIATYNKSILNVLSILVCYIAISLILMKLDMSFYKKNMIKLTLASFNCCVHGILLVSALQKFTLSQLIAYSIGSGIGFTLAMLLIYAGKQRISMLNVPRAFKGLPITLVYIGILSLAIYGLIGHQLPS